MRYLISKFPVHILDGISLRLFFFFLFLVSFSSYLHLMEEEVKWSVVLYQLVCFGMPIPIEIEEKEKLPYHLPYLYNLANFC